MTTPHERDDLRRDLERAFAGAETLPPAPRVVHRESEAEFWAGLEQRVAAAERDPPSEAFLARFAHTACFLTPAAERWYWRALLTAAIEDPWPGDPGVGRHDATSALLHTACWVLRPNPCAVLFRFPTDEDGAALRARLTPAERAAVSRFLGRVVTHTRPASTGLAYLAAQAIRWAWRDDPESAAAADALHRDARTYVPQIRDNPEDDALIGYVEDAFAATPPPEGQLMTSTWEEESAYALELAGTDWRDLATWFLWHVSSAYSFMSAQAFRYYLPAALRGYLEGAEVDPTFHLVTAVVEPSSYRDAARACAAAFTPGERDAVAAFLRHVVPYDEGDVATALAEVWEAPAPPAS